MTAISIPQSDSPLSEAYQNDNCKNLVRGLIVANVIGSVGMPSGVVLDYFLYPDWVGTFLLIRLGVSVALLSIAGILMLRGDRFQAPTVKTLGILSALIINFSFCLMIFITNGVLSPYYAAVNLILTCWAILLPWRAGETALLCVLSLLLYAAACIFNPTFREDPSATYPLFAYYSFFILITTAVCISISFFLSRARFEDFRLRHQLDEQNRELQDLDRIKTQFFSNVSHELRTPLTLILGPVETLLGRGDTLDDKVHAGLVLIHRSTLRLLKLINELLDLTRLDQGAEILRKSSIPLGAFLKGMVDSIRHLGLSKKLRIKVEEGDPEVAMIADSSRIEKVLVNLLTNAIKYTPAGGSITIRWHKDPQYIRIEVQDTGVGIPEEDLPRIFDRFHQVRSNMTNQNQGVGIGLALAKELVELHDGKLEVESEVGRGTIFRILLPVDVDLSESEELPPRPMTYEPLDQLEEGAENPFEKAFRAADRSWRNVDEVMADDLPQIGAGEDVILVADDENDMRHYIVSLLSEDHRVVQTQHGGNVVQLADEHDPKLMVLDWMMPGKDGVALCRELRAKHEYRDLKILLLTARIDEKSKIEALQAGADDFLTKPFSSVELKTRVANLLRSAHLQKDLRTRNEELSSTIGRLHDTEAKLIQSEKMNAIGSLSAGLLHEINNPLNYTLTAISMVRQLKDSLNPDMLEIFTDIEEGMLRIRDVITDLKDFAYPEKVGTESVFSLAEVFRSAKKIAAGELEGVRLEVELSEDLMVRGQKTQMTHVFINLLSNAGKAVAENSPGKEKVITVRGRSMEEMAEVEVFDSGPGIPEDILGRVFEPFFTTRAVGAGMGMGLSVCHTIMESHQGSIRVGNRPEGGAIFTFNLPLEKEAIKLC